MILNRLIYPSTQRERGRNQDIIFLRGVIITTLHRVVHVSSITVDIAESSSAVHRPLIPYP